MADDKKNARAAWDEVDEGEAKAAGVSPAVAKALLSMNPALREQGLDTMKVVRQSQDAAAGAKKTAPAAPAASSGIYDTLKSLDASVKKRDADIAAQISQLEQERRSLQERSREEVSHFLLKSDPDILSPVTQSALKDFDKLLQLIGFKTADYVAKYRKNAKR